MVSFGLNYVKIFFSLADDICLCFAYIPPHDSVYFKSHETGFFESLEAGIRQYSSIGKIGIIGDLNARCGNRSDIIQNSKDFEKYIHVIDANDVPTRSVLLPERVSMDTVCNSSGIKLLDICHSTDLRIVNGRIGSDAGIGHFTYMSPTGESLIDYAIMSQDIFHILHEFVVHELYSCSPHVPIQINLGVNYKQFVSTDEPFFVDKLIWDDDKNDEFRQNIISESSTFQNIVDMVVSSEINIDHAVSNFADVLYKTSFKTYGTSKQIGRVVNKKARKFKSPWFTKECETARQELKRANKLFAKNKSQSLRELVVSKRRLYNTAKRHARTKFKIEQKSRLHNAARTQPQEFWREIRKIKGNCSNRSTLTSDEFYEHFKGLYSTENVFANDDTEQELENESYILRNVEQLDCNFSIQEVEKAIGCLKRGKSSGEDSLIPEIFLESKTILSPIVCRLFNYMFDNSIYPECWTRGIIVPVPKKGNLNDVNNYRGITLTSVFSKIFSLILDNRLRKWAEDNEKLSDSQFGFRAKRSTVDCIFVLTSIEFCYVIKRNCTARLSIFAKHLI